MKSVVLILHLLSAIIWIGGMFFAHMALRPAVANLPPPQRLSLMAEVLQKFFQWVWASIILIVITGFWGMMTLYGSMSATPLYVHGMLLIGVVMIAIFVWLFYQPYPKLRMAIAEEQWPVGAQWLGKIRLAVLINLCFGLSIVVLVGIGRY